MRNKTKIYIIKLLFEYLVYVMTYSIYIFMNKYYNIPVNIIIVSLLWFITFNVFFKEIATKYIKFIPSQYRDNYLKDNDIRICSKFIFTESKNLIYTIIFVLLLNISVVTRYIFHISLIYFGLIYMNNKIILDILLFSFISLSLSSILYTRFFRYIMTRLLKMVSVSYNLKYVSEEDILNSMREHISTACYMPKNFIKNGGKLDSDIE